MSAENKEAVSRRTDAPDTKPSLNSRGTSGPSDSASVVTDLYTHGSGVSSYQGSNSYQQSYRQGAVHVAPTVGMPEGALPSNRVRTLSGEENSGGFGGGYRAPLPQHHGRGGYMPPPQHMGLTQARLQQMPMGGPIGGPMQPAQVGYHAHVGSHAPMQMYGQMPAAQAMPPQMYNGNAPSLGYAPMQPQGYFNQPVYDERFQYGVPMQTGAMHPPGNPMNTAQLVSSLQVESPQQRMQQPGLYGYPQQAHTVGLTGPAASSSASVVRKKPVLKDKDGNVIDLTAVKSAPAPNPAPSSSAAPNKAFRPSANRSHPAVAAPSDLEATKSSSAVPPAEADGSNLTEGSGDIVIEGPEDDDDVVVPVAAETSSKGTESSRPPQRTPPAPAMPVQSSIGPDAFSSDFIIEPPEEDDAASAAPEPEPQIVPPAADASPSVKRAEIGVQAPVEPVTTERPCTEHPEPEEEDDEWENSEIPDINKLHLAAKEEKVETTTAPEFIFPTSKGVDNDIKRNKKTSKRDKYATADAAPENSGMLDAYTVGTPASSVRATSVSPAPNAVRTTSSSPSTVGAPAAKQQAVLNATAVSKQPSKVVSKPPTKVSSVKANTSPGPAKPVSETVAAEPAPAVKKSEVIQPAPEQEKKTSALYVPPALAPNSTEASGGGVRRSLRPGGGKTQEVLNVPGAQANRPRLTYTKRELKALVPNPMFERPPVLQMYNMINIIDGNSSRQVKSICMGGTPPPPPEKTSGGSKTSASGGFSSDKWAKQAPPGPSAEERAAGLAGFAPPPMNSPHQHRHGHGRNKRNIPMPMPKKQYDQLEKYGRDVQGILNKISPGNFQKLIVELCNIPCVDAVMMEKLISLIFEKALQEPSFSKMYADMCFYIEYQSPHILCNFFYVVRYEATLQYRWVRDLKLSTDFAGPFQSELECLAAMEAATLPQMNHVLAGPLVHYSLTLRGEYLIQVAQIIDRDTFYTNRIALEDVDPSNFSERFFANPDAATKDYIKKNGFRRHLVTTCQNEFVASVNMESKYFECNEKIEYFEANKNSMTEEQRQLEALEIEELVSKLKRRMLGNIRFIGELFKSNMLREANIFDCIEILMVKVNETGAKSWKVMDERSIEILCKLLTTVGEDIRRQDNLDDYFDRMQDMSVDKSLNSRMRFMLIEVMDLRANRWAGREAGAEKNAYVGGFIHTILPPESQVIRKINNMPGGLASGTSESSGTTRLGRSGSGSATNSPIESRAPLAAVSATSIAPTLFANPPSANSTPVRQGSPSIPLAPLVASPSVPSRGSSPIVTAGKTRRPSAGGGSFDSSSWRSPSPANAAQSAASNDSMTTPVANKRKVNIDGVLEDYFSLDSESADAEFCLDDMRLCPIKDVVAKLLERALEARPNKMPGLIKLTEQLCPYFSSNRGGGESAIENAESIQLLGDMVLDYKEAPEQLGVIIGVLVAGGACDKLAVQSMLAKFEATALDDEFAAPEIIKSAFARLKAAASL